MKLATIICAQLVAYHYIAVAAKIADAGLRTFLVCIAVLGLLFVVGLAVTSTKQSYAERISTGTKLKILKKRLKDLQDDTSEQWQRDEHPELVREKRELAAQLKALEDSLL